MARNKFTPKTAKIAGKKGGQNSKRLPLDVEWREKLLEVKKVGGKNVKLLDGLFNVLLSEAREGNVKAIQEVLDRSFGKSTQKGEITGADGSAIKTEVTFNIKPIKPKGIK